MKSLLLAFAILGQTAVAQVMTLTGADSDNGQPCSLFVLESDGQVAKVSTSYAHDADQSPPIVVRGNPKRPNTVSGTGDNGRDQIAVMLSVAGTDLTKATQYNFKWWHHNHFHTFRCLNLKVN